MQNLKRFLLPIFSILIRIFLFLFTFLIYSYFLALILYYPFKDDAIRFALIGLIWLFILGFALIRRDPFTPH